MNIYSIRSMSYAYPKGLHWPNIVMLCTTPSFNQKPTSMYTYLYKPYMYKYTLNGIDHIILL